MTVEDSSESEVVADTSDTEAIAEDSSESAGTEVGTEVGTAETGTSRVGRGWFVGIAAGLVLLAGGMGAGGYFALRAHQQSQIMERNDAAAVKAAMDCVAATQAPDTSSMAASEQKIIDCGTDEYRTEALLNTAALVQAYKAANVHLEISDMKAAVERNNRDGTVDVLTAFRVKMASDQQPQPQEVGYRLRVTMAMAEGQYKIARLELVMK